VRDAVESSANVAMLSFTAAVERHCAPVSARHGTAACTTSPRVAVDGLTKRERRPIASLAGERPGEAAAAVQAPQRRRREPQRPVAIQYSQSPIAEQPADCDVMHRGRNVCQQIEATCNNRQY